MTKEMNHRLGLLLRAAERDDIKSIYFSLDGASVDFTYHDPAGDHGLPCDRYVSIPSVHAYAILAGLRFSRNIEK